MRIFTVCLAVLWPLAAIAAERTIDEVVTQTLADNPELAFYEAEILAAKGEKREAGAWKNPELSGELGAKRTVGDGLDAAGVVWALSVQQQFEWPGRVSLRKAIADRQVRLAEQGLQQFRAALAASVRQKAFALLAAQRKQRAAADVATRGQDLVSTLVQRDPSGVAARLESRAIEASVLVLRRREVEAASDAQAALLELNQLRGKPLAEKVVIAEPKQSLPELPAVPELIKRSSTGNFELQQRVSELEQQGFKVRLEKKQAWPGFTAGPSIEQETAGDQETRAVLAISLPVPLWNQNKGNIAIAKAREMQAQTSLIVAQRDVERQIREESAAYTLRRQEMLRWSPEVVRELEDAADLADRHYRLGAVPLATYLEVQSNYLDALDAVFATQSDALQALVKLEQLTGSKLQ